MNLENYKKIEKYRGGDARGFIFTSCLQGVKIGMPRAKNRYGKKKGIKIRVPRDEEDSDSEREREREKARQERWACPRCGVVEIGVRWRLLWLADWKSTNVPSSYFREVYCWSCALHLSRVYDMCSTVHFDGWLCGRQYGGRLLDVLGG